MKKPDIKKLKYPIWFTITFYVLTILAPLALTMVQGFRSTSSTFRVTFGVIASLVLLWSFSKKFILVNIEKKLLDEKVQLEHEYKTGIGDSNKIKYLWYNNELFSNIITIVELLIKGLLIFVLAEGIAKGLMKIEGLTIFIVLCYLVAFGIKFICILTNKNKEYKEEIVNEGDKEQQ